MKRFTIFASLVFATLFISCSDKNGKNSFTTKLHSSAPVELKLFTKGNSTYAEAGNAFDLDYSVQVPEPESVPKRISTKSTAAKKSSSKSDSNSTDSKALSSYLIKYNTKRSENKPFTDSKKSKSETTVKELTVVEWGPEDTIISEMESPVFYVTFSEPVRELSALSTPEKTSDVFSIEPTVEGFFRWNGTKQLSFQCVKEALNPGTEYKISINKNLKALSGHKITGKTEFTTKAQELSFEIIPGLTKDAKKRPEIVTDGILPEIAQNIGVISSSPLSKEEFQNVFYIGTKENNAALPYTFTAEYDSKTKKSKEFFVQINKNLDKNSKIYCKNLVSVNKNEQKYSKCKTFETLKAFKIKSYDKDVSNYSEEHKNCVSILFNQTPDINTIKSIKITYFKDLDDFVDPLAENIELQLTENNYSLNGKRLYIFNLNFEHFGAFYTIHLDDIKDIYGQKLENQSVRFAIPKAASFFKLCDTGIKMLEAQFPHRLAFAHQNLLENSWYQVAKISNPLFYYNWKTKLNKSSNAVDFDLTHPDQQVMDYVDLESLLDDGYGWIDFTANTSTEYYNRYEEKTSVNENQQHLLLQITDLGITARVGINKAVFMVRSLSKNTPVENAKVVIYLNDKKSYTSINTEGSHTVSGTTDKNGFAVINISNDDAKWIEANEGEIAVYVENGKDKATFFPKGHSWNSGLSEARKVKPVVFIFSDRKLYKPGETISFRGIDKNLHMGRFSSYTGPYKITLESSNWKDKTVYYSSTETTSESGGFYGKIDIPKDIEPAFYRLMYYRPSVKNKNEWTYASSEYIDIRYFEQTKLQTEVEKDDVTYIGGATLNVGLHGTYLAGGSIAEGQLDTSWYSQPSYFRSLLPETKNFSFGPEETNDYRKFISEDNGTLDSEGKASVSIASKKITNGSQYTYTLEAGITDVSNEQTFTRTQIIVHPAKFYIGVGTPLSKGFPEKGKKLEIAYTLVTPDDEIASEKIINGDLKYTVKRISWEVSNANGIDDDIYSRYHKVETDIATGTLKGQPKGTFSFTPEQSGEYIIQVSGYDNNNNKAVTDYYFYATGSDSYWFNANSSGAIDLVTDQSMYNPGDTAKILLKSSLPKGDYLITVEREGIYTQEIKHFDSPSSVIEIPVADNYLPYAYVCVASYSTRSKTPDHKFGEKDMDKPTGYFGKTKIHVNPNVRAFSIEVKTDKTIYRPGDMATVTLKATKGGVPVENAELSVMGVDRAVIDLINYHVPNPIDYFYSEYKFYHCVAGGDSRNLLMDPVTYAIKNLQGGDADEDKENQRKDFRPTAFFEPVVTTDKKGIATVTFKVPSQLTTFRVTAFGVKDQLFALQEDEFGVRNPVNVQAVQPRLLRIRDTAECGVVITNLSNDKVSVKINLEIRKPENDSEEDIENGLVTFAGNALIDGEAEKSVTIEAGETKTLFFNIAATQEGTVNLVYKVTSDVLNETLFSPLKIQKTFTYETTSLSGSTTNDETSVSEEQLVIPGFAEEGEGNISVTLDATRLGILNSAISYVFNYPYGCFEQRTSKVLPLVIFDEYIKVFGLDSKVRNTASVVKKHFKYLSKYQKQDGGFGYWPESEKSELYVSSRILDLCYICLDRGYKESDLSLNIKSLENFVFLNSRQTKDIYGLYVISKHGSNANSYINSNYESIKKDPVNLNTIALTGLAILNNDSRKAKEVADFMKKYMQPSMRGVTINKLNSSNMGLAHALKLLVLVDESDPMVDRLLYTLLISMKNGYWTSTKETAAALDAVYTYIKARKLDDVKFNAEVSLAGLKIAKGEFSGAGAMPVTETASFKDTLKNLPRDTAIDMKFTKKGTGTLYYGVNLTYALPDELQNARSEGITVNYEIFDSATDTPVQPEKDSKLIYLESGKTYKAKITLDSNYDVSMLALRTPVPSGAAILDAHFVNQSSKAQIKKTNNNKYWWKRRITSQALYDNEGHFFWDEFEKGSYTLEYQFRANRRGVYPCPPVTAECMYEPELFGRSDGYLFVIK